MAIENYFLSRDGRALSSKILKFMRSLIIKIDKEANEEETKETYLKWLNYKYAYEGTDDIYAYNYGIEDCNAAGLQSGIVSSKKLLDHDSAYKLQLVKDPYVMTLLNYLRKQRIESYVETNSYYYQFLGKPRPGQEILIANKDKENDSDPDFIEIQNVNIENYPLTFEYVFVSGLIEKIKSDNPSYHYLLFLENKESIYRVRCRTQYDIIYCDESLLNETELENFYKIYAKKKLYMQELMYVQGFNSRMEMYPFMMELLLLQDVFMSFFNSYMENFSLANYSDQEIYDILDSYNLSNLKKVKMSILRKIIREIPDLMELRGSDLIIEKLLDIVTDESVTIKRYYLTKIYNTDEKGQILFNTNKTYDENVDLVFKEKIIRKGNNSINEGTVDYDSFVEEDDTWGGDLANLSDKVKNEIKQHFKRELIKMDFSSILTKYLTISSTINSYTKQIDVQNLLGLLWQWLRKNDKNNFMIDDEIDFTNFTLRPIDIYAAICWLNQYLNGVPEPETIRFKNMNIANIMYLRDSGVESLVNQIQGNETDEPIKIRLPAGLGEKSIIEVLGEQDDYGHNKNTEDDLWPYHLEGDELKINYEDTIVSFNKNITLSELFTQYNENIKIINALKNRWIKTSTLQEAKAWEYLITQNRINTQFHIMFDGYEKFNLMLKENARDFYNFIMITINTGEYEGVYNLYIRLLELFREYMLDATENKISLATPNSDENDNSVDYLNDLKILFNEFLSVYTELHKIEFSQIIDDSPYNRIKILYQYDKDVIFNTFNDKVPKIGTLDKSIPSSNKEIGYGEITSDSVYYKYAFEMMRSQKIESRKTQISETENKIFYIDSIINNKLKPFEKSNIISRATEELERLNYIINNSIGGGSSEILSKKEILEQIIELLNNENLTVFYRDIFNIEVNEYSGKNIIIDFTKDEIEELKKEIDEINKRQDILPYFKTFIESELFEVYTDKIIFVKLIKSINKDFYNPITNKYDGKMLYHYLNSDLLENKFSGKVYLDHEIGNLIMSDSKDKLKLIYNMIETDISITLWVKDYLKFVKYTINYDEHIMKDNISLTETIRSSISDSTEILIEDVNFIKLKYLIEEQDTNNIITK